LALQRQLTLPFTLLLGIAYVVPGLVGHDPWKPNEAYSFGIIYNVWGGGDWVVPILAGEPFMEKPRCSTSVPPTSQRCFLLGCRCTMERA